MNPTAGQTSGNATMFSYQTSTSKQTKAKLLSQLPSQVNLKVYILDQNLRVLTVIDSPPDQWITNYEFNLTLLFS